MERDEKERGSMVGLINGIVGSLKVYLRELLLQGSRQKAEAERHALPSGV